MQITVVDVNGNVAALEMDENSPISDLKALIEIEMKIPTNMQVLLFNNKQLHNNGTLKASGIADGDMIQVQNNQFASLMSTLQNFGRNQQQQGGGMNQGGGMFGQGNMFGNMNQMMNNALRKEAEKIKAHYENSPNDLQFILHQRPEFATAVLNDDINVLIEFLRKEQDKKKKAELAEMERIRQLESDPFNPENQKEIEKILKRKKLDEIWDLAQEHHPEAFASVTMLYIDSKINGHPIQAFVDSGAQSTFMSKRVAEQCGIFQDLDDRFAGVAAGVGTGRILGRVLLAKMQIKDQFFQCSIQILEGDSIDFLFGLDMLKRHQCTIDLNKNVLTFRGGELAVPFLSEGEIKRKQIGSEAVIEFPKEEKKPEASGSKPATQGSGFPEDDINKLISLGFTRDKVIQALKMAQGNAEIAASYLFSL